MKDAINTRRNKSAQVSLKKALETIEPYLQKPVKRPRPINPDWHIADSGVAFVSEMPITKHRTIK